MLPTEGLGNRLQVIASVADFAGAHGGALKVHVLWPRSNRVGVRFARLFQLPASLQLRVSEDGDDDVAWSHGSMLSQVVLAAHQSWRCDNHPLNGPLKKVAAGMLNMAVAGRTPDQWSEEDYSRGLLVYSCLPLVFCQPYGQWALRLSPAFGRLAEHSGRGQPSSLQMASHFNLQAEASTHSTNNSDRRPACSTEWTASLGASRRRLRRRLGCI